MTIQQLVEKHGLPITVRVKDKPSYPEFTVHTEVYDGWLVDYESTKNHFIVNTPHLDDYELKPG